MSKSAKPPVLYERVRFQLNCTLDVSTSCPKTIKHRIESVLEPQYCIVPPLLVCTSCYVANSTRRIHSSVQNIGNSFKNPPVPISSSTYTYISWLDTRKEFAGCKSLLYIVLVQSFKTALVCSQSYEIFPGQRGIGAPSEPEFLCVMYRDSFLHLVISSLHFVILLLF